MTHAQKVALAIEVLTEAKRLLVEVGWCQTFSAVDRNGHQCPYDDPAVAAYCPLGAHEKAKINVNAEERCGSVDAYKEFDLFLWRVVQSNITGPYASVIAWNDHQWRKHAEVVALFDAALAMLPDLPANWKPPTRPEVHRNAV